MKSCILITTLIVIFLCPTYEMMAPHLIIWRVEEPIIHHQPDYIFTCNEIYLMTQLLCGDESIDGDGEYDIDFKNIYDERQVDLVLSVVMNRVKDSRFPNSIFSVITQPGQFSPMPKNLKAKVSLRSFEIVKQWCLNYGRNKIIPDDHVYFSGDGLINRSRRG